MQTISNSGTYKLKCPVTSQVWDSSISSETKPNLVKEALQNPMWKETINLEYEALQRNGIWNLVPYFPNMNNCGT